MQRGIVWVVDDDSSIRWVLERALAGAGLTCTTFENGAEVLEEQQQPRNVQLNGPTTDIIGEAPAMQDVFRIIGRLSRSSISVLINGESGTGKELVAHALHRHSPRAKAPFIALNMAAIPKDLIESELFGHEKGAFTGANTIRQGRFEQADGGTLFLDEIGDMRRSEVTASGNRSRADASGVARQRAPAGKHLPLANGNGCRTGSVDSGFAWRTV